MGDGRLLVRVRTASYAVPEGFSIAVTHVGNCSNGARDEELLRCIGGANPKVIPEMIAAAKAAMMMMGCPPGCHVNKDCSGGILFQDHSQDSAFVVSSGTSVGHSSGTGSLVGERLIEGVQGTPSGEQALRVGCVSQFTSSWPPGLSGLGSSEHGLYRNMKLDRSSDADYVPSSVVVNDVAMSLGDNKTTEVDGLGDSKHAGPCVSDKQGGDEKLPSSVPYSLSATQDILGALAEYEAGTIAPRPAELDSCNGSLDFMDDVEHSAQVTADNSMSDHDRIVRLEKAVEDERDLFDQLRDIVEDLEVHVGDLTKWKNDVMANGCSRCRGKSDPAHANRKDKGRNLGPAGAAGTSMVPVSVAGPSKGTLRSAPTGPARLFPVRLSLARLFPVRLSPVRLSPARLFPRPLLLCLKLAHQPPQPPSPESPCMPVAMRLGLRRALRLLLQVMRLPTVTR